MRSIATKLGVECVDSRILAHRFPVKNLGGWGLKPYSIIHSPFEEALLLDADNVPVRDPSFLFDDGLYLQLGSLFWPDYGRLAPDRDIWRICELEFQDEPEFESGQLLINKSKCWRPLQLTMHLNENSEFYYRHVHGDKETFHMAWKMEGVPYGMIEHPIHSLPGVMCQHDPQGEILFQHRNLAKWNFHGRNPRIPGFIDEPECLAALEELRGLWDGVVHLENSRSDNAELAVGNIVETEMYMYRRIGHDERPMQFLPGGEIGIGGDRMERRWMVLDGAGQSPELIILGDSLTCTLRASDNGVWRGHWAAFERMPVQLVPLPRP